MSIRRQSGFTLLEIMLAIAILSMVGIAMFRLTSASIKIGRSSQELIEQQLAMRGFERLLRVQVGELQFQRRGCISGDARSSESAPMTTVLTLVVPPGNPTLSSVSDSSSYEIGWELRTTPKGKVLGFTRRISEESPSGSTGKLANSEEWIPLISNLAGADVQFFSGRLNQWLPKWTETNAVPDLLKVQITPARSRTPWEFVIPVPPKRKTSSAHRRNSVLA